MRALLFGLGLVVGVMSSLPQTVRAEECGIPYLIARAANDSAGRYDFWTVLGDVNYPVNLTPSTPNASILEMGHPSGAGVGINRLYQQLHEQLEYPRRFRSVTASIGETGQLARNEIVRVTMHSATDMEIRRELPNSQNDIVMRVDIRQGTVWCSTDLHSATPDANVSTLYRMDDSLLTVAERLQNETELQSRAVAAETAAAVNLTRADTYHRELTTCVEVGANLESTTIRQERAIRNLVRDLDATTKERDYLGKVAEVSPELIGDIKRVASQVQDASTRATLKMLARKYAHRIRKLSKEAQ